MVSWEIARAIQAGEVDVIPLDEEESTGLVVPTQWPALERANAVCQLQALGQHGLNKLAAIALICTDGDEVVAWKLLVAGWSPHEAFMTPTKEELPR